MKELLNGLQTLLTRHLINDPQFTKLGVGTAISSSATSPQLLRGCGEVEVLMLIMTRIDIKAMRPVTIVDFDAWYPLGC